MQRLGDKPIPPVSPDVVVGIPCDLLMRRPDVRRTEQQAAAQSAQIGIAESDLYPAISITGTVAFDAQRFTDLFKDHSLQGQIGPGFQWNVLNYGRLINNVRLQDARFCELVAHYRNTVLQANSEAEDSIAEFLQSQLQAKDMQRSVDAAAKAVDLAITQYKGGLVDFNRVAVLEQNLVQQQDLLAQAEGDIDTGLVHLYRSLGGGWERRCEGVFDNPAEGSTTEESIPQGAEELPAGNTPSKPGPTLSTPDQNPNKAPTQSSPIPNYQQQPGTPRHPLPLPGPDANSAPTSGARMNKPTQRPIATQSSKQSFAMGTATRTDSRLQQTAFNKNPMEHQPSSQPLQLRRTNDEASFNWADESIPLPPDGLANERDAFRPQYPTRAKEPAVQTDVPTDTTNQASEKAGRLACWFIAARSRSNRTLALTVRRRRHDHARLHNILHPCRLLLRCFFAPCFTVHQGVIEDWS